jgi:hypothetical protein
MALRRPFVSVLVAFALAPGTGCSWIFVHQPPTDPIRVAPPVVCTTSVASPVVDTVLAAAALGTGIAAVAMNSKSSGSCTGGFGCLDMSGLKTAGIVAGVVLGATAIPLAFSAGYGYSATAECRELKDAQLACISGVEASCNRLMRGALEECERSSKEACNSAGDGCRSCHEGRTKSCMEAAGWTEKQVPASPQVQGDSG